jgi:hypothetical protein
MNIEEAGGVAPIYTSVLGLYQYQLILYLMK